VRTASAFEWSELGCLFSCILLVSVPILHAAELLISPPGALWLDTFEDYPQQSFPGRWEAHGAKKEAEKIYHIIEEADGNHFLHAHAQDKAIQIGLAHSCTVQQFSRLHWRWRVTQLPRDGDERRAESYDSAAGVYVLFGSRLLPRMLKYVWSATVPVGSRLQSPLYWNGKTVVLQSGSAALGVWKEETVNFYRDYQEVFAGEPGEVLGFALMTSADSTKSAAEADYDDFQLLPPE
jgi:hypothetical protein